MLDKNLLIEAEKNSTFDLGDLEKTLRDIKENAFHYLYETQKELVEYKRFDFKMGQMKRIQTIAGKTITYPKRYGTFIDENFITERKRHVYRRSPFFNKIISAFDVANNPGIFTYNYIVFVDGKYMDGVNLFCDEDHTYLLFDIYEKVANPTGLPQSYFDSLVTRNVDVSVYYFPNCAYGLYNTNRNVLQMYKDNLSLDYLNIANNLSTETQYITFINDTDQLFTSVITETTNSKDALRFTNTSTQPFDNKYVHLNVFGFRNLLDQINIPSGKKFFSIPRQDMPVPVENLMFFKVVNGVKTFAHNIRAKLYYPNVYEILDNTNDDELSIYVFYSDDSKEESVVSYKNEFELYNELFPITLADYENGTLPLLLRDYVPMNMEYNLDSFEAYTDYQNHLKYKIDTLNQWINQDGNFLHTYLKYQFEKYDSFYLDMTDMDLTARVRTHNLDEIDDITKQEMFPQERYLFVFRNEYSLLYGLRFFIDGKLYCPDKFYMDEDYTYFYLPTTWFTPTSIMEVEKFHSVIFSQTVAFAANLAKMVIAPTTPDSFLSTDIFLVDTTTRRIIPRDKFKIFVNYDGEEVEFLTSSFKKLTGEFTVQILDNLYVNKSIAVYVSRQSFYSQHLMSETSLRGDVFLNAFNGDTDERNYRIFKDGKMIPRHLYHVNFGKKHNEPVSMTPFFDKKVGEHYVVDYSPYRYQTVLFMAEIDSIGLLDLYGYLNKPFDLKWYDVYLNGRRLNMSNIDIITPTVIFIKNVQSRRNLVIIQKDRDPEYFSLTSNITLNDQLWDTIPEFKNTLMTRPPLLNNETDLIASEATTLYDLEIRLLHDLATEFGTGGFFINPDETLSTDFTERYEALFQSDVQILNPDDRVNAVNQIRWETT